MKQIIKKREEMKDIITEEKLLNDINELLEDKLWKSKCQSTSAIFTTSSATYYNNETLNLKRRRKKHRDESLNKQKKTFKKITQYIKLASITIIKY